jgi:Protein of unknown function (DUF2795)
VSRYLQGVQCPACKEELLGRLERNGVPGPLIGQLRKRLPEGKYRGPQDVLSALRRGALAGRRRLLHPARAFHERTSENSVKRKFNF